MARWQILAIALLIGAFAAVCRTLGRRRIGLWSFAVALAVAYCGSMVVVGDALLTPLEGKYPPLREDDPLRDVRYVVVLGRGYSASNGVPIAAALQGDGLVRIVEGIGSHGAFVPCNSSYRVARRRDARCQRGHPALARDLGIDAASLVAVDTPIDTKAEAQAIAARLHLEPFILVTSAYHRPRAV